MDLEYKVVNKIYTNTKEVLKEKFGISSRLYLKLRKEKHIFLNGQPISYEYDLKLNDIIGIDLGFIEDNSNIVCTKMNLDIIYEDDYMLVLNKPPYIAVHPSMSHYDNSLSNGVKYYFDSIDLHRKIRIVNRLDRDTSGIVIFAKNEYVQENLISQMSNNTFKKEYLGFLTGCFSQKSGTINAPIARKTDSIIERCIDNSGQISITHYEVIKEYKDFSLVHFELETGRTHQIRVHSQYIGHPLLRRYSLW